MLKNYTRFSPSRRWNCHEGTASVEIGPFDYRIWKAKVGSLYNFCLIAYLQGFLAFTLGKGSDAFRQEVGVL